MPLALAAARFAHYGALTFLFGALLFPIYAGAAAGPARRPGFSNPDFWLAVLAVVSEAAWYAMAVAGMAGDPAAATDPSLLLSTLRDTWFGHLWAARLAATAALALLLARDRPRTRLVSAGLCGLVLASLALTGHARDGVGWRPWVHGAADAAHLLCAGFWIGALPVLASLARAAARRPAEGERLGRAVRRFSCLAVAVVAALVATGALNALLILASPRDILATPWGRVLLFKLALVGGMLTLAAVNRGRVTPALAAGATRAQAAARLSRNAVFEAVLAIGVLAAVAVLGMLSPTP